MHLQTIYQQMIFSNENAKIGGDRMTSDFMKELLSKDEKITVEYKTCQYGIQEDVYETVCSFSNRYGGYIIMGVEDDGTPIGINPNMVKNMKKNFVNQLNNPDKMSPTLYLSIEDIVYEGMTLLWVYVPPTSIVEKCANRIYDSTATKENTSACTRKTFSRFCFSNISK